MIDYLHSDGKLKVSDYDKGTRKLYQMELDFWGVDLDKYRLPPFLINKMSSLQKEEIDEMKKLKESDK